MDSTKKFLALGFVFLSSGVMFLCMGFATHLLALTAVGLVQITSGIAIMVVVKARANAAQARQADQ